MKAGKLPVRVPTAKPTIWHKDKSRYDRKENKKEIEKGEDCDQK